MSKSLSLLRSAGHVRLISGAQRAFTSSACRRDHFLNADKATFVKVIEERSKDRLVLADFYADWCGPCKMLSPILEKLTAPGNADAPKSSDGRSVDLITVDTDEQSELALEYGVKALPTVVAFKDGKAIQNFIGAVPEAGLRKFIRSL